MATRHDSKLYPLASEGKGLISSKFSNAAISSVKLVLFEFYQVINHRDYAIMWQPAGCPDPFLTLRCPRSGGFSAVQSATRLAFHRRALARAAFSILG